MNLSPEQMSGNPEIVQLNKEFVLFDPRRTQVKKSFPTAKHQYDEFISQIQLQIPSLPLIPIRIETGIWPNEHKHFGINPFDPEAKKAITAEDFNLQQRIKKFKEACEKDIEEQRQGISAVRPEFPLILDLSASIYTLHDLGLCDEVKKPMGLDYVIKPGILEELEDVYLSLIFPSGSWISESEDTRKDGLGFYNFHPSDTAPLACNPDGQWAEGGALHKGVPLLVPAELNTLNQIKGKFLKFITN